MNAFRGHLFRLRGVVDPGEVGSSTYSSEPDFSSLSFRLVLGPNDPERLCIRNAL